MELNFRLRSHSILAGTVLLCSALVSGAQTADAVPAGAARTVPALVKAYVDAVQSQKADAVEALFDLTPQPPAIRSEFRKHLAECFTEHIANTSVVDPDPDLAANYAKYHAHFQQPVVKMLKITYAATKDGSGGAEYYIGSRAGLFYFITLVREP